MTILSIWSAAWPALGGGLLIGAAAALFLLGLGRIAGVAGLVAGSLLALRSGSFGTHQRVSIAFVVGLVAASWPWHLFAPVPLAATDVGTPVIVAAGLLVGVGVRMANGCTSGHGVCGLSRLSIRSVVNVCAFMVAGIATVFVLRHLR